MSNFSVKHSYVKPEVTVKLDPGQALRAVEAAKTDGADNLFFEVGTDTYVASAKNLAIKTLKADDQFEFQGQPARVLAIDNESKPVTTIGVVAAFAGGGLVGAGAGATAGIAGEIFDGLSSIVFGGRPAASNLNKQAVVGAVIGAAVIGGIVLASKMQSDARLDLELMKNYGSPVNK